MALRCGPILEVVLFQLPGRFVQRRQQLSALLKSLDTEVQLEPIDVYSSDATTLRVSVEDSAGENRPVLFSYVPSAGLVQLEHTGGQFPQPPECQQAMAPIPLQP